MGSGIADFVRGLGLGLALSHVVTHFKKIKILFLKWGSARRGCCRAATLRVAGASEGCRFAAAGPNNVRQG